MLNLNEFHSYFQSIAEKHTSILHNPSAEAKSYFRFGDEELNNFLSTRAKFPLIVMSEPEADGSDSNADNNRAAYTCGMMVLAQYPADLPLTGRPAAQDLAQQIMVDILAKMVKDSRTMGHMLFNSFRFEDVSWNPIHIPNTRSIGWDLRFQIKKSVNLSYNSNAWTP